MSELKWQEHKENATGFTVVPDAQFADEAIVSEETLTGPALHRKIAEVMERRSDYWLEFSTVGGQTFTSATTFIEAINPCYAMKIIHHPPKVKLSGKVEPEVIEWANDVIETAFDESRTYNVAKALLSCVQEG